MPYLKGRSPAAVRFTPVSARFEPGIRLEPAQRHRLRLVSERAHVFDHQSDVAIRGGRLPGQSRDEPHGVLSVDLPEDVVG
jgi:hypothetical protein